MQFLSVSVAANYMSAAAVASVKPNRAALAAGFEATGMAGSRSLIALAVDSLDNPTLNAVAGEDRPSPLPRKAGRKTGGFKCSINWQLQPAALDRLQSRSLSAAALAANSRSAGLVAAARSLNAAAIACVKLVRAAWQIGIP